MLKRSCLALAAAVLSLAPSVPVLAQSTLSNQDVEYLGMLHWLLRQDKDYDFALAINGLPNETKVSLAKDFCEILRTGRTYDQMAQELFQPEYVAATAELNEYQRGATRKYIMAAWFVGVKNYCPEYDYQLRAD